MLYEGQVIHAQHCPFWTQHFESRILNKMSAEAKAYVNECRAKGIKLGGFSLTMKVEVQGNVKHIECYVYGHAFIANSAGAGARAGEITFLEVLQPNYDQLERHEISLSDEVSRIKIDLEGVSEKQLRNGEIRNIPNTSTPLLKCRYSRIVECGLESETSTVQTTHTEPAPAAKNILRKYTYAPLAC